MRPPHSSGADGPSPRADVIRAAGQRGERAPDADPGGARVVLVSHGDLGPALLAQLDGVFFEASGRTFPSDAERAGFRERWLGRYLRGGTDVVLLALDRADVVAGYLVGALRDPAEEDRFADIGYFRTDFRDLCRRYPAHLHVNLAPAFRGCGLGARLIDRFSAHVAAAGAPGLHVVTGKSARNVRFYLRCGFAALGSCLWSGRDVVFLGKALGAGRGPAPAVQDGR